MDKLILAYDIGTEGSKASLFSSAACLASAFLPYETEYPLSGWHEQRPTDWWDVVVQSTRTMMKDSGFPAEKIAAIGITGHAHGCIPLNAAGQVLRGLVPIWSDSRPVDQVREYFKKVDPVQWYRKTGCGLPAAHYPLFKAMWFRDNEPDMFGQIDTIVGTKDYINFRLTGEIATDFSYASGSGFYNLRDGKYDESLLEAAGLDLKMFPKIVPSTETVGTLTPAAADALGFPASIPVVAGGVNTVCKAVGAKNIKAGRLHASLGPSSWVGASVEKPVMNDQLRPGTFVHVVPGLFLSTMGDFSSGTSFRWIRDHFCGDLVAAAAAKGVPIYDAMIHLATQSTIGANRLLMNPCFAGGSSLDPSPNVHGALLGLDLVHTRADVIRAALEGIALNLRVLVDAFRGVEKVGDRMCVVGGGSINPFWRQIYADALRITIEKTSIGAYAASLGAAVTAGVGTGLIDSFDRLESIQTVESVENPIPENAAKYDRLLTIFKKASVFLAEFGDFWVATENEFQTSEVEFD